MATRQRARWRRHDAHLWIRHDAARFRRPGSDPADGYRALARERDAEAREARQFNAAIEQARALLAALRIELAEIKTGMARRRLAQQTKYSPSQPRVPAGNPRGGQWSDGSGGGGQGQGLAMPMGNADVGDLSGSSELTGLFDITPADTRVGGVQVGGDVIRVCIASGISSWKDDLGIKNYSVTYDCAGGRTFTRNSIGYYRGIVRDPNR